MMIVNYQPAMIYSKCVYSIIQSFINLAMRSVQIMGYWKLIARFALETKLVY